MATHEQDLQRIADDAAEQASERSIKRVFSMLGVDITDQNSINEFRADLIYARELRKMSRTVWGKVLLVLVTGGAVWVMTTFGAGIKAKLGM